VCVCVGFVMYVCVCLCFVMYVCVYVRVLEFVGVFVCGICNVCVYVCVGYVICGCFGNMCTGVYSVFALLRLCTFVFYAFV